MDENHHDERRKYYRLRYPIAERPTVQTEDDSYTIAEISEGGARILIESHKALDSGNSLVGVVTFHDGEALAIEGIVLRSDSKQMAIQLSKGVSPKRMIAEQVHLRSKFPMMFGG